MFRKTYEDGAHPRRTTDEGKTAIDLARERGHTAVAEMLATVRTR